MSLKKILHKTQMASPKLLLSTLTLTIGAALFFLCWCPETALHEVAWLETEGMVLSISIGLGCFILGVWGLFSCFRQIFTRRISCTKGTLIVSIQTSLFEQIVQQLWSEYFGRSDLQTSVTIHGKKLDITGEIPGQWDQCDELCSFLSDKLLTLTGYWGDIRLRTILKP